MSTNLAKPILFGCIVCPFTNKVRFALELLNVDYTYEEIDILTGKNREESYLKINPQGRVPSLSTKDGRNLYDSQVLLSYIEDEFGQLFPKDNYEKGIQRIWVGYFDNNIFSKYHPAISAYQEGNQEQIEKLHQEAFTAMKNLSNGSGLTERITSNPKSFFSSDSQATYADVAMIPHLRLMNIFWKNFLNKDLFQVENNDKDVLALKQLFDNVHSLPSCLAASYKLKILPEKGKNPLIEELGFTSPETFDFEAYIIAFLKAKFPKK